MNGYKYYDQIKRSFRTVFTSPTLKNNLRIVGAGKNVLPLTQDKDISAINFINPFELTSFDSNSIKKIIKFSAKSGIEYANDAVDEIIKITKNHPYKVQLICNLLYDEVFLKQKKIITTKDIIEVHNKFEEQVKFNLQEP